MGSKKKADISSAEFLKTARKQLGLSQGDVAKKMGYDSAQFISNIERSLASPPIESIFKLSEVLGFNYRVFATILLHEKINKLQKQFTKNVEAGKTRA